MKKVFIPILISAMLLGGLSAFAENWMLRWQALTIFRPIPVLNLTRQKKMVSRFMKLWIPPKKVPRKS